MFLLTNFEIFGFLYLKNQYIFFNIITLISFMYQIYFMLTFELFNIFNMYVFQYLRFIHKKELI